MLFCKKYAKIWNIKEKIGTISLVQYIGGYNEHEPDCFLNHEGSASDSENLLYHCKKYFCPKYFHSKHNYQ